MVGTKGRRAAGRRMTTDALAMSTSVCRNLFLLQDNESSCCEQGQHQVQTGGGIEGDGDDRRDGDEDALYSPSLDNSPSTRSRAPTMLFEQEKAAPEKQ
ncbi:hypothetical protein ARMGADRAFT_429424 [Armillaria gallica]|uniref:Uncharacterized protein n=1 Tax=Armillaria gallica TaxID=47427 RepID=A0A2H3DGU9_ARMGA|nr:hypothetical protein ARMGADRAFT_429424 [Armillaria gallica]